MASALLGLSKSVRTSAEAKPKATNPSTFATKMVLLVGLHFEGLPGAQIKESWVLIARGSRACPIFLIFPTVYSSVRLLVVAPTCFEQGLGLNR